MLDLYLNRRRHHGFSGFFVISENESLKYITPCLKSYVETKIYLENTDHLIPQLTILLNIKFLLRCCSDAGIGVEM